MDTKDVLDLALKNASRKKILEKQKQIDQLQQDIRDIAKAVIEDYHFLDYKVSTFWTCEASPIGMCLFHINQWGHVTDCRYCGGPEERK